MSNLYKEKCMDNNRVDYSDQVLIEKVDQSVYDEQGRLIAQIYYAKPVIQGDSEAVKKINAYFDNEANAFFMTKGQVLHGFLRMHFTSLKTAWN